jgi:hypothetical protein
LARRYGQKHLSCYSFCEAQDWRQRLRCITFPCLNTWRQYLETYKGSNHRRFRSQNWLPRER